LDLKQRQYSKSSQLPIPVIVRHLGYQSQGQDGVDHARSDNTIVVGVGRELDKM